MTHDLPKRTLLAFLTLSLIILAGHAMAQDADVTGTWVGSTVRGGTTMTLVLKQDGNSVTGSIVGYGTGDGPVSGTVKGNAIRLRFDNSTEEWPLLNVKGNEITGFLDGGSAITLRRKAS
jgi:hypothetical protein